jgi:hypothetical protein
VRFLPNAYRPFLLAEGLCLSTSFSTSFAFLTEVQLSSGFSLRPGVSLHHPHFSCITPALRLQESRSEMPITRAVCYYARTWGKVRKIMTKYERTT